DDRLFEPRSVQLNAAAASYKLRSTVTGHGQNGEFVARQHYLNVNGGSQEFQYDVWKYCGKNPIYPQGGTWVFDRAGWCPGMATDLHEFKMNAAPGSTVTLDYGLNGAVLGEANYLVSNQLVSYGAYAHPLDASIEAVMRPNDRQVEFARINPACSTPLLRVRNNGSTAITSLQFSYMVIGGTPETFTWTGNLSPETEAEITLPVLSPAFWETTQLPRTFQVQIVQVNDQPDGESANNLARMSFSPVTAYTFPNPLRLRTKTNNTPADYSYTIKDAAGNVVLDRNQMTANTSYTDLIDLPAGCYTLNFEDTGNDGLSFWFFPENGAGSLNIARLVGGNSLLTVKSFNPDFGGGVQYDFVIGETVGTENPESATRISLYPNPAKEVLNLDLQGFAAMPLEISLRDVTGRVLRSFKTIANGGERFSESMDLQGLPAGLYFVRVTNGQSVWSSEVVKE
ncbi:MAG: T9SS type A sorting domain-containing protein, partial [Saprospiraceae bacterium]